MITHGNNEPIAIRLDDGTLRHFDGVTRVYWGAAIPQPNTPIPQWHDCSKTAAPIKHICELIDKYGFVDLQIGNSGQFARALAYIEPSRPGGIDDDFLLDDGTHLCARYWHPGYTPNPTRCGFLIYAYGIIDR